MGCCHRKKVPKGTTTLSYEDPISADRPSRSVIILIAIIVPIVGVTLTILIFWICIRKQSLKEQAQTLHKIEIQPTVEENIEQDDVAYAAIRESQMTFDWKSNANTCTLQNAQRYTTHDNVYNALNHCR